MCKENDYVFFGTPDFAVLVLEELKKAGYAPSLIITAPDKPKGRGLKLTPPPVKVWAENNAISVLQPETLDEEFFHQRQIKNPVLGIVAAYGKIISKKLLDNPSHGWLNVHPSLLPRWRGASPVQAAILEDDKTGVTIMQMDEKLDHGPIVAQREYVRKEWPPKAGDLENELARFGGALLAEIIPDYLSGSITTVPQDDSEATYCKKFTKEDSMLDFSDTPKKIFRKIQAFTPRPGAYFFVEIEHKGKNKKIRVRVADAIMKDNQIKILRVVPEGKREMDYGEFIRSVETASPLSRR